MPLEAKPLFRPDVLRTHLGAFAMPDRFEAAAPKLAHWAELLSTRRADSFKEQEILPDFLTDFFCGVLGYTRPADGQRPYTISREKHVEVDGKFADAVLGQFNGEPHYLVALEGKGPRDPTWFYISKTAQPLRLRGDHWQYCLFTQSMKAIPIPEASGGDRAAIASLAERCADLGLQRHELQSHVQRRLAETFGVSQNGESLGLLNEKAQAWWDATLATLGAALKTSFKLTSNPLKNPRVADEWEPYLKENRAKFDAMTRQLADAEAELNDRVYRLFDLTPDEVKLLRREVEH